MAFEINIDSYSYSSEPKKDSENYAAELAKKLVSEEAEERMYADKALKEQMESAFEEEATERKSADSVLQEQITTERVLRETKDKDIEAALVAEISERNLLYHELNSSISELGISIAAEISERRQGDETIEAAIVGLNNNKANKYDVTVDQTYNEASEKAQSGKALKPVIDEIVELADRAMSTAGIASQDVMQVNNTLNAKIDAADERIGFALNVAMFCDNELLKKADKTTIGEVSSLTYEFPFAHLHNNEIRLGEVNSVSFTFGNGEYSADYISGLSFDSGATPTAIDYAGSGILNWVGTDCHAADGLSIFQPSAHTHYDIVFYFNGIQFIGLVNGFVPAAENVVSA